MRADLTPHPLIAALAVSLVKDAATRPTIATKLGESGEVERAINTEPAGQDPKAIVDRFIARIREQIQQPPPTEPATPGAASIGLTEESATRAPATLGDELSDAVVKRFERITLELLRSPDRPLNFVTLTGYLGPGIKDTVRLYLDPTLETFVSLREDDVLLRHPFITESAPFNVVDVVWVKDDVVVGRARREPRRDDRVARYLEGDLMEAAELSGPELPTSIPGAVSDEPFCVTYTCCKKTSNCPPGHRRRR